MRITFITVILSAFMLSACGSKETAQTPAPKAELPAFERAPVFKAALDYNAVSRIEGCTDEVPRDVKYHNCRDSKALYARALSTAKAMDAPLMCAAGMSRNISPRPNTSNTKLQIKRSNSHLSAFTPAQTMASLWRMNSASQRWPMPQAGTASGHPSLCSSIQRQAK